MKDINSFFLVGRLTRDVGSDERSFGYVSNGQARANVSIAVNSTKKNGDSYIDEVNYFDITVWGKMAESLKPYLVKGKQIAVEGHLKQDRWEKDGQKFSKVALVADNIQLLGGRNDGTSPASSGAPKFQPNIAASNEGASGGYQSDSFGETGSDFPEDIPF